MIFKRAVAKLRAQDWTAITIELLIVIIGVFIGTWVANWNQDRLQRSQTHQMLLQLKPELHSLEDFSASARRYYAVTGDYARLAFAGWGNDPKLSDEQFVIAAYQASQIYGFSNNGASWALAFGANDLRNIDDAQIRDPLTRLMTFDYSTLSYPALQTKYRDEVRTVIPDDIQEAIRAKCGDRINADKRTFSLVVPCPLRLDPAAAQATAAELRRHPELPRLLRVHRSTVATFLTNLALYEGQEQLLEHRVSELEE
jgi:hypothetical protein